MSVIELIEAIDEWAHRRGMIYINGRIYPCRWRLTPFALLCRLRWRQWDRVL